jgi:hypothetical protein
VRSPRGRDSKKVLRDVTTGIIGVSSLGKYFRPPGDDESAKAKVRDPVTCTFKYSTPLGIQLAPASKHCIVVLALNPLCGPNAPALEGLRVGHELLVSDLSHSALPVSVTLLD